MNLNTYFRLINGLLIVLMIGLALFGDIELFAVTYAVSFVFLVARTTITPGKRRVKAYLIAAYFAMLILQVAILERVVFAPGADFGEQLLRRVIGMAALVAPMLVSRYVTAGKYAHFYLPSVEETATVGISELVCATSKVKQTIGVMDSTRQKLSGENVKAVVEDLSRHDSFRYINNGSLTEDYFERAAQSLGDPNIYLIISKTGSPASEIISVFTQKQYNHASLSFDRELQTTISYNGGEKTYPPGLNKEMLAFFQKSPDARILIYSLPCTTEQKKMLIEKIAEINREGSAYNMLGLVFKRSYRPNIMFCSQFIYKMLDYAGLSYFSREDGKVSPTDLIELDYYKKLVLVKEIKLGDG